MELDYKAIGQNIREYRRKSGLNQKELAELVNLSPQHISHIEAGHTKLSLPTLVVIANALSTDCNSLLGKTLTGAQDKLMCQELLSIYEGMDYKKRQLCVNLSRVLAEYDT